jgi:hypothetical protein
MRCPRSICAACRGDGTAECDHCGHESTCPECDGCGLEPSHENPCAWCVETGRNGKFDHIRFELCPDAEALVRASVLGRISPDVQRYIIELHQIGVLESAPVVVHENLVVFAVSQAHEGVVSAWGETSTGGKPRKLQRHFLPGRTSVPWFEIVIPEFSSLEAGIATVLSDQRGHHAA